MKTELITSFIKKLTDDTNNKSIGWSAKAVAGGVVRYKCSTPDFDVVVCTTLSTAVPDVFLSNGDLLIQLFSCQDHTHYHTELRMQVLQLLSTIKLYINEQRDCDAFIAECLK